MGRLTCKFVRNLPLNRLFLFFVITVKNPLAMFVHVRLHNRITVNILSICHDTLLISSANNFWPPLAMGRPKYIYCGKRSDAINQKISVTSNVLRAVFCVLFLKVLTTLGLVNATRNVFLRRNCLPWRSCLQPSNNCLNHGNRFHAFVNYASLSPVESCPKKLYSSVGAVATEGGRGGDLVAKNVVLSAKPKNEAGAKAAPIHLSAQEVCYTAIIT